MATLHKTNGYTAEGYALEATDAEKGTYPVKNTAVADDEVRGATLEAETLSQGEPAQVTSQQTPQPIGYAAEGRALEAEEISPVGYPENS